MQNLEVIAPKMAELLQFLSKVIIYYYYLLTFVLVDFGIIHIIIAEVKIDQVMPPASVFECFGKSYYNAKCYPLLRP